MIKEERPELIRELGKGYGMPSSHAQFVAFWSVYVCLFLGGRLRLREVGGWVGGAGSSSGGGVAGGVLKKSPGHTRANGSVDTNDTSAAAASHEDTPTDRDSNGGALSPTSGHSPLYTLQLQYPFLKNLFLGTSTLTLAAAVAWSRIYLSYHTPKQVLVGSAVGAGFGIFWFGVTGYLRRSGVVDWVLELRVVRMARVRDLVCEEDLVELGWQVWEGKRARRRVGSGRGKGKRVRVLDPKVFGNSVPAGVGAGEKKQR